MSEARRYSPDNVWLDPDGRVGITSIIAGALREITHLELPEVGVEVRTAARFGSIEGHKGVVDLYSPADGHVVEVNADALDAPKSLTEGCEDVWLMRIEGEPGHLMTREEYLENHYSAGVTKV